MAKPHTDANEESHTHVQWNLDLNEVAGDRQNLFVKSRVPRYNELEGK